MKIFVTILALLTGGWMLADGLSVIFTGKFIGPEKPGPWALLFYKLDVNVFKLGPVFIFYGLAWMLFIFGLLTNQSWFYKFGIVLSILTLWYIPAGTLFSLIILLMLIFSKERFLNS